MSGIYVLPGKKAAAKNPVEITTILGSCVSVILYDEGAKCGGLNHFLLPQPLRPEASSWRYGVDAIPALIEDLLALGASREKLVAKVYGGANVLKDVQIGASIGKRNIEFALETLEKQGIRIVEKSVGGEYCRKIAFNVGDFSVRQTIINYDGGNFEDVSGYRPLRSPKKIKVAIIDDSATVRTLFSNIFTKSGLEVVGTAIDAYQAREIIINQKPDVITLDIEMPRMNGVIFLEKLMQHMPMPVVMVSSLGSQGEAAIRSLDLGAVEFIHKPSQYDPAVLKQLGEMLVEKVKAAATVNVLKRDRAREVPSLIPKDAERNFGASPLSVHGLQLIVVGGNIGSQSSLETFLRGLHHDSPPVLVSNPTIASFVEAYIEKIRKGLNINLTVAKSGLPLKMGTVYFSPPDHHIKVLVGGTGGYSVDLDASGPIHGQRPSSDFLFRSAAEVGKDRVLGILLGGFGRDGVDGLSEIQDRGGYTIAETPETCAFPYGPQQAISLGVVDQVRNVSEIVSAVMEIRNKSVA